MHENDEIISSNHSVNIIHKKEKKEKTEFSYLHMYTSVRLMTTDKYQYA